MAEVPREAVEFARMAVRAFHPPEFVVAVDGVLRTNNYCSHNELAQRLKLAPKDLRITMVKLVTARLMKSEKRIQKKINIMDDRRSTRTVNTEFWYVPLPEVIDAFVYRVHRISSELDSVIAKSAADRMYVCKLCQFEYTLIEASSQMFRCHRYGVSMTRRPTECGGDIIEQDNSAERTDTESLKRRFEAQLKPLRERAEKCAALKIPAHPLEGADEDTWGALVPETIGAKGERVNEDGFTPAMAAQMDGTAAEKERVRKPAVVEPAPEDDDAPIPEKPSWFQEGGAGDDDNDADWDEEGTQKTRLQVTSGTAASFGDAEDAKSYYAQFLAATEGGDGTENRKDGKAVEADILDEDLAVNVEEEVTAEENNDSVEAFVKVAGRTVKLSDVTTDMQEEMTPDEFEAYFALVKEKGGDDEDDDDEEYE